MAKTHECDVLVVGGGPIGLFTAFLLQRQGIRTIICERNDETTKFPKMDITNGRSMELFRSAGLAEKIRDAAVPRERATEVLWTTGLNTKRAEVWDLAWFRYGTTVSNNRRSFATNDGSVPLEPGMRMSQVVLEPLIKKELEEARDAGRPIDVWFGWAFKGLVQDQDGVTATLENKKGESRTVRCSYLAGCDGGSSKVRSCLGQEKCWGLYDAFPVYTINFSSPRFDLLQPFGEMWHTQWARGTLINQDGKDTYTIHMMKFGLPPGIEEKSPSEALYWALGDVEPFEHTINIVNHWAGHLVLSPTYGEGRVWMAGDSVHQVIPTGGYGMNSGIGDAWDLAWKLGAMVKGWGGPHLLPTVLEERRPVMQNNIYASAQHAGVRVAIGAAFDILGESRLKQHTPKGRAARQKLSKILYGLTNLENECTGNEVGYRYKSAIVLQDNEHSEGGKRGRKGKEPEHSMDRLIPTTWPGSRVPNVWLAYPAFVPEHLLSTKNLPGAVAIHDLLDPLGFTLIRFDLSLDTSLLLAHAIKVGMPLALLDVLSHCTDPILLANAARVYERKLLLVRPDQHVAWRSDIAPSTAEEAAYVLDVARGAIVKKRGPQIPVLGALYRLLVRGPLSYFASTWFGRFLSRKRFEMGLVGTLMYRLSILARVKLLWLWMTV